MREWPRDGLLRVSYGLVRELLAATRAGRLDRARRIAEEMMYGRNAIEAAEEYCDDCSHSGLCDRHKSGNYIVKQGGFETVHFSEEDSGLRPAPLQRRLDAQVSED